MTTYTSSLPPPLSTSHSRIHSQAPSPTPSPTSTFDGGEYFLDREAKRSSETGFLAMSGDENTDDFVSIDGDGDITPTDESGLRRQYGDDGFGGFDGFDGENRKISGDGEEAIVQGNWEFKGAQLPKKKPLIRFAPLNTPLPRRLQTLAVLWHATALSMSAILFWSIFAVPAWWPIILPYLLHLLFSTSHQNGSSPYIRSNWLRSLPLWSWYNAYFPIHFHRSTPLDPTKNYIFGYSPHGIISFGAWGCFVTDSDSPLSSHTNAPLGFPDPEDVDVETLGGTYGVLREGYRESRAGYMKVKGGGFKKLFPGIKNTLLTLDGNFRIPIYREYLLAMGMASVSRRSCEALLGVTPGEKSPKSNEGDKKEKVKEKDKEKEKEKSGKGGKGRNRSAPFFIRYPFTASKVNAEDRAAETASDSSPSTSSAEKSPARILLPYILSPFTYLFFFLRLLAAFALPIIPPAIRESYLRRRSRNRSRSASTTNSTSNSEAVSSPPGGNSITIVLGGARESLLTQPKTMNIILHRRRGFIKLALSTPNTALVPCLAFGENDVYETLKPDTHHGNPREEHFRQKLEKFQIWVKKVLGFTIPVFWARGVFNYDVGLLPFREPINVVVGRPIFPPTLSSIKRETGSDAATYADVVKRGTPGQGATSTPPTRTREEEEALITEMQRLYEVELLRMWEEWKDEFAPGRKAELKTVM